MAQTPVIITWRITEDLLDLLGQVGIETYANVNGTWQLTPFGIALCDLFAKQSGQTSAVVQQRVLDIYADYVAAGPSATDPAGNALPSVKFIP